MTIMFLLIFYFSTKTTQPIKKLFLPIDSWIVNYQITKCVLHLDYASKPKNSTEAIYEWNPQLLSCQPNTYILLSQKYGSRWWNGNEKSLSYIISTPMNRTPFFSPSSIKLCLLSLSFSLSPFFPFIFLPDISHFPTCFSSPLLGWRTGRFRRRNDLCTLVIPLLESILYPLYLTGDKWLMVGSNSFGGNFCVHVFYDSN